MISLFLAAAYLGVIAIALSAKDPRMLALPIATLVAWHFYYVCQFASMMLDSLVILTAGQLNLMALASGASLILLLARGSGGFHESI